MTKDKIRPNKMGPASDPGGGGELRVEKRGNQDSFLNKTVRIERRGKLKSAQEKIRTDGASGEKFGKKKRMGSAGEDLCTRPEVVDYKK